MEILDKIMRITKMDSKQIEFKTGLPQNFDLTFL